MKSKQNIQESPGLIGLVEPDTERFLAKVRERLVGFLVSLLLCGVGEAILNDLWVEEKYRKSGIATKLLQEYENELKKRKFTFSMAYAKKENIPVEKFNEKSGYKKGEIFQFYYKWLK